MRIRIPLIGAVVALAVSPALAERHLGTVYAHLPQAHPDTTIDTTIDLAPPTGEAVYAVQRTQRSQEALWHDSGCIDFAVDAASVTPDVQRVIDTAFAAWTDATRTCGSVSFATHREPRVAAVRDGSAAIVVRADRWCRPATAGEPEQCYPPEVAAMTRLVFIDDPSDEEDGRILEVDIELNAVSFDLLLPGQTAPAGSSKTAIDLQSVVTHEAGHVLGLAHNCATDPDAWPTDHKGRRVPACTGLAGTSNVVAATMYYTIQPGDTRARTPEAGDVQGACAMARGLECTRDVEGGCSAGGSSSWLIALLGVAWLQGRARSCARRSQRGERRIA